MEWYDFLVGTRRYRHHREKGAMHFHSTTYLSFIQSCSKTERHFCILLSYIRLRWPELSCRLFARSYISKVVYFFPNAMRIKPSQRKGIHHTGLRLSSGLGLLGDTAECASFQINRYTSNQNLTLVYMSLKENTVFNALWLTAGIPTSLTKGTLFES